MSSKKGLLLQQTIKSAKQYGKIRKLCDEDALAVAEAAVESIRETNARIVRE